MTAEDIVRAIAADDPMEFVYEEGECHYCRSGVDGHDHEDGCLWLAAREWLAEHPEGD